jgi:hypothetical protein
MMEAARTSETLVNFYQTTRCYNPEDSNLHIHYNAHITDPLYNPMPVRMDGLVDGMMDVWVDGSFS